METITLLEQGQGQVIPQDTIRCIINEIAIRLNPCKIIMFGSYAKGNPGPDSDLDLMIIMNSDLPKYKRGKDIHLMFRPMPCALDVLIYTPEEVEKWNGTVGHLITEVIQTGKVVYEQQ